MTHGSTRVLLALALATFATTTSRAEPERGLASPPTSTVWLHARTGITFSDTLTLGQSEISLATNGTPSMTLGLGAHWRTARVDLGVYFEALSSWSFPGLARQNRVGSQFRAVADLRWRYVEDAWGSLFLRLTPGLMVMSHADPLRFQVAGLAQSDLDDVDRHNVGFTLGFDFGATLYVSDSLAVSVDLDLISVTTSLGTASDDIDYSMVRGIFGLGLEWRL